MGGGEELTKVSGNCTFRSPTATAGGMSERSFSLSTPPTAGATLPFLGVVRSVLVMLPTLCAVTERLLFVVPKLLMRLKNLLVRLLAGAEASSEMMEAEPEELTFLGEKGGTGISSAAGVGEGRILLRPQLLRREVAECRVRCCSVESRLEGAAAGVVSRGGRKACETGVGVGMPRVWLISMRDSCRGWRSGNAPSVACWSSERVGPRTMRALTETESRLLVPS